MRGLIWGLLCLAGTVLSMTPVSACDSAYPDRSGGDIAVAVSPTPAAYIASADRLDPSKAIAAINAVRAQKGVGPLSLHTSLNVAAQDHARDLAARNALSHFGADGSTPADRVAATGYDAVLTGENIAAGQRSFDAVLHSWIDSEAHAKTLFAPTLRHAGLALVHDRNAPSRTFWTMVVAEPF